MEDSRLHQLRGGGDGLSWCPHMHPGDVPPKTARPRPVPEPGTRPTLGEPRPSTASIRFLRMEVS